MFSKFRKHLNIMWLLLILLIGILGIVLVGVYSIDDYCQDNIVSKIKSDDNVVENQINSIVSSGENILKMVEISLSLSYDMKSSLKKFQDNSLISEENSCIENVLVVQKSNYYDLMNNSLNDINEISDMEWYTKALNSEDMFVSNTFEYKGDKKYVAMCKKTNDKKYIIAACINIEDLNQLLNIDSTENAYFLNQNNVIITTSSGSSYININALDSQGQLPKGHADVFKNINIIDETEEINTSGGRLLVSYINPKGSIYGVIIRDKTILIQDINNRYLEVLAMLIAAFLLIVGICIVATRYIVKVREVNNSKCEFIEEMATEIKVPLDSINYMGKMIHNEVDDENIIQQVNTILENTHSIAFALNCAFDYSKIATNDCKIENNNYSVKNIIRTVEKVVRCDVQKNNVYFDSYVEGNEDLKLFGDQRKIEEIIINLVKVAAHHTIQGGIELKVMYADLTVDRVNLMLVIEDSGVGMTDNELSDYSEELNNVPLSLKVSDTGIGINMVKQLIKILNGKIVVDSTKNVGSVYTIMIPQKIVNNDESKWENENVKSSAVLMGEYSMMKKKENRTINNTVNNEVNDTIDDTLSITSNNIHNNIANENFNGTTEIEKDMSTPVERREIRKNEEYFKEDYSNAEEITSAESDSAEVLDYLMGNNNQEIASNEKLEINVEENIQEQVEESNVQTRIEEANNDVQAGVEEDDGNIYDIPMPENQAAYLTGAYYTQSQQVDNEQNDSQEQNIEQSYEMQEETQIQEQNYEVDEDASDFEIEDDSSENNSSEENYTDNTVEDNVESIQQENYEEENLREEVDPRIDKLKTYFEEFGIDVENILEEFEGDIDGYEHSLLSFYEYSKTNANRIISLWNSKQIKEYFSAIDVVSEGAKGIGVHKLVKEIEEQLEKGQQGDLKYVATSIKDLFTDWKKLLSVIAKYLQDKND